MLTRIMAIVLVMTTAACNLKDDREKQVASSGNITFSGNINFDEVLWFASRAKAAYDDEQSIRSQFPNTVRVVALPGSDVQYFLEKDEQKKQQIISVRGTANLANAKEDAEYVQGKDGELGIYVHKGFEHDTKRVYDDVITHLDPDYPVIITGHSLGAAISTLLMMHLHEEGYQVLRSINFGQPKVTNHKGVKKYEFLPLLRVVNQEDVVPLVPPITLLSSIHGVYEHLGEEVVLYPGEKFDFFSEHQAERLSIGSFWKNIGHESVEDHFMVNYLANIDPKTTLAPASNN